MKMGDIRKRKINWLQDSFDRKTALTIDLNESLTKGVDTLLNNPYKILAVTDQNKVSSIVSRTDITKSVVDIAQKKLDPNTAKINDVSNHSFLRVSDDDNIGQLIDKILDNDLDHLIVTQQDGKLAGIVDRKKLVVELEKLTE